MSKSEIVLPFEMHYPFDDYPPLSSGSILPVHACGRLDAFDLQEPLRGIRRHLATASAALTWLLDQRPELNTSTDQLARVMRDLVRTVSDGQLALERAGGVIHLTRQSRNQKAKAEEAFCGQNGVAEAPTGAERHAELEPVRRQVRCIDYRRTGLL